MKTFRRTAAAILAGATMFASAQIASAETFTPAEQDLINEELILGASIKAMSRQAFAAHINREDPIWDLRTKTTESEARAALKHIYAERVRTIYSQLSPGAQNAYTRATNTTLTNCVGKMRACGYIKDGGTGAPDGLGNPQRSGGSSFSLSS